MQRALVVYNPRQAPRDHQGARRGFAEFLQRGGRARPVSFDGPALSTRDDVEAADPTNSEVIKILRAQTRFSCVTSFFCVIGLVFVVVVFVSISIVVTTMQTRLTSLSEHVMPYADNVVDSAVETMQNVRGSMQNVRRITKLTSDFAEQDLAPGGAAGKALNSTAIIAERLARFMAHPTIQLSLGSGV